MSSILDALNKLEREKAQARREQEDPGDPAHAAHDLVGRSVLRDRVTLRVSPATLLISGGAVLVALIAIVLTVAIVALSPGDSTEVASASTPIPATDTPSLTPPETPTPEPTPPTEPAARAEEPAVNTPAQPVRRLEVPEPTPMPAQVQPAPPNAALPGTTASATNATPPAPTPNPQSVPSTTTTPVAEQPKPTPPPAPTPSPAAIEPAPLEPAPEPVPDPVRVARRDDPPPPRAERSVPAADAAPTRPTVADDLKSLPILTSSDLARHGLLQLKINMPAPAGPRNPQGSAVLTIREESGSGETVTNTMKFYENQRIQSTSLRLFKVEQDGIGIEDLRSGQKFWLPF